MAVVRYRDPETNQWKLLSSLSSSSTSSTVSTTEKLYLTSPNGTSYALTVSDDGVLQTKPINSTQTTTPEVSTSYANLLVNGDFENAFTNWVKNDSFQSVNTLKHLGSNSIVQVTEVQPIYQDVTCKESHTVYCRCYCYIVSTIKTPEMYITAKDGTSGVVSKKAAIDKLNQWQKLSVTKTVAGGSSGVRMWLGVWGGGQICKCYYDDCVVIDLTASFGVGKEPDLAWCDANL